MTERRSLVEGLKSTPPEMERVRSKEEAFVYGDKEETVEPVRPAPAIKPSIQRVPVSTRIRSDYAAALKRVSLQRQLSGEEPNTLQDILEEAINTWLAANNPD